MTHAWLRGDGTLMVFAAHAADDYSGPYQVLAPALLARPEAEVVWLAEDGRLLVPVPAAFIRALLDGDPTRASDLLAEAIRTLPQAQRRTESQP